MKLTEAKSKIVGLVAGDVSLNYLRPDETPLYAKVALLSEDGSVCGYFERQSGWSEKVHEAMKALADAVEDDCLEAVFHVDSAPVEGEKPDEPQQF